MEGEGASMKHKTLSGLKVKDEDKGEVTAVFATFNVKDYDGDVTLPGAFEDGTPVRISAYGHNSWSQKAGLLPVGRGTVVQNSKEAILEGRFFMDTIAGRETFATVKAMDELQEWSYSVEPLKKSHGDFEGEKVQFLEKLKGPTEVSPVLVGAGIGTRTLDLKDNLTLVEQISEAMDVVAGVVESAERVGALRAEKGKGLSQVNKDSVDALCKHLEKLQALLTTPEPSPGLVEDIRREHVKLLASL